MHPEIWAFLRIRKIGETGGEISDPIGLGEVTEALKTSNLLDVNERLSFTRLSRGHLANGKISNLLAAVRALSWVAQMESSKPGITGLTKIPLTIRKAMCIGSVTPATIDGTRKMTLAISGEVYIPPMKLPATLEQMSWLLV